MTKNSSCLDEVSEQCYVTTLYSLLPIGIGTPLVECLTSYVTRLAEAHCVSTGTLISKVIIPQLNKPYLNNLATTGGTRLYNRSHAMNGIGNMAESWCNVLYALTGCRDLIHLTWRPWRRQIPSRELLKQMRCWCSVCFDEQAKNDQPIYEPLLWTSRCVSSCAVHDVQLISTCPNCGRQMPALERKTSPGRCSKCNSWLGEHSHILRSTPKVQHSFSAQIGQLLSVQTDASRVYPPISDTLHYLVDMLHDGNVAATARYLQIPKTTFWDWINGSNLPTLEQVTRIFTGLNTNLVDAFQGCINCEAVNENNIVNIPPTHHHRRQQGALDLISLKHALVVFEEIDGRSLRSIANLVGVSERTLRKHFPDECANISERLRASVNRDTQSRKDSLADSIRQATIMLHELTIYPSRRKVEAFLNSPGALREKSAKTAWHDTLCNIGLRFDKTSYRIDETSH